jgi:glycosyltransferase involved in cell wall biosynthesis
VIVSLIHRHLQESWPASWIDRTHVRSARLRRAAALPFGGAEGVRRRLFVDLSVICRHDAGTGIQRIARSIAMALIKDQPAGWEVVPVAATRRHAYRPIAWPNDAAASPSPGLQAKLGDVFLGLDFALDTIPLYRRQIVALQEHGVSCWFCIYDLLPIQKSEWFSDALVVRFRRWLRVNTALADGYFCISPTVADDLYDQLVNRYALPASHLPAIRVLPLGWEVHHAPHSTGVSAETERLLAQIGGKKTVLLVGTLEPRKGHADVLAAFDRLWASATELNLVIVGRPGWKTEDLQGKLRSHPLLGRRLFWLDSASDEEVQRLYQACSGVVVASQAEGFGLPLIEALGYRKPVLARDIPVFRTVPSLQLDYFPARATAEILATSIARWLDHAGSGAPEAMNLPTWGDSARHLVRTLAEVG